MTDAALSVTQSAVEGFTRQYLTLVGCTIETEGDTWTVSSPDGADTELVTGTVTLYCGSPDDTVETTDADIEPLHPESGFFQELLAEAAEHTPVGTLTLRADQTEVIVPGWLAESDLRVTDTEFQPYYDRTALMVTFRVRVETVSEYQQELLRAVAVDTRSGETLSNLAGTVLEYVNSDSATVDSPNGLHLPDTDRVANLVEAARSTLMDTVHPTIDNIQQQASRAAQRELEDYRRMNQQREQELETDIRQLQDRIEDISTQIDDALQDERIELLKERRTLRNELNAVETEHSDLQQRRRQGFPDHQQKIRDRHSLTVTVAPATLTFVEYERGEAEFHLDGPINQITLGYGVGEGSTEDVSCEACGRELNEYRPLGECYHEIRCGVCSHS